jgi:hypothetical protein
LPSTELSAAQALPESRPASTNASAHSAQPAAVSTTNGSSGSRRAPAGSETKVRASGSSRAKKIALIPRSSIMRSHRWSTAPAPGTRATSPVAPMP